MIDRRLSVGAASLLCWGAIAALSVGPGSAQTMTFAPVGSLPGPADIIEVHGGYAYVAAGPTLTVFDVANPAAPKRTAAYTFPERIWGFKAVGSLLYVAADWFGLGILDVSNPAAPTLRGSIKTPGQAKNVAVSGTKAMLADHVSGVDIVDISNLAKPTSLGAVFLDGYARDVAAFGSLAYAVDNPSGLYVLDLSKPDATDPVASIQSANVPRIVKVALGTGTDGPNIAVLVGDGSLQVYDLSKPVEPVHASTFRTPGGALRVALKAKLAYVADGSEGLQVVDLSTASTPRIVGAYKPASPARDVAVADSLVFVVVGALPTGIARSKGGGEVMILRQSP